MEILQKHEMNGNWDYPSFIGSKTVPRNALRANVQSCLSVHTVRDFGPLDRITNQSELSVHGGLFL